MQARVNLGPSSPSVIQGKQLLSAIDAVRADRKVPVILYTPFPLNHILKYTTHDETLSECSP